MENFSKTKARDDFYDDVHLRRSVTHDQTLCGLKAAPSTPVGDVTCLRCRQFASGDF